MDIWTKTDDGYCAEISDLQGNGNPPMPETSYQFPFSIAEEHWNHAEGEFLYWTHRVGDKLYTVFND